MDELDLLEMEPPPPDQHLKRIRFFAKALAYGVVRNRWLPDFGAIDHQGSAKLFSMGNKEHTSSLQEYVNQKWSDDTPHPSNLVAFGYLQQTSESDQAGNLRYRLSREAFQLLEEPASPPSVFISYRHDKSSAFGLLIVARLQAKGVPNPFIDMNLQAGDAWHAELEEKVRQSRYFVCLIAPETLSSEYVITEIRWALSTPTVTAIPIWHNGFDGTVESEFDIPADIMDFVKQTNAIAVKNESADDYNTAVIKLLNRMGYAP